MGAGWESDLGFGNGLVHVVGAANFLQHFQHSLIGASMGRAPQSCDSGCYAGKGVGLAGACMQQQQLEAPQSNT